MGLIFNTPTRQIRLLCAVLLGIGSLIGLSNSVKAISPMAPSACTAGDDWELEFKPGPLRLYVDPVSGNSYWYFTYTVANYTDRDRMFAPKLELFTDEGEIIRSGRNVPSRINKQLRDYLANPLLEDQNRIIGELLVGRENARTGLAVWPINDLNVTQLTLFVAGLSSDAMVIVHPLTKKPVRLQRTLRREYLVPGNPSDRGSAPLPLEPRKNRRGPECENEFPQGGCWIYR
jgi:hypothetical protein